MIMRLIYLDFHCF